MRKALLTNKVKPFILSLLTLCITSCASSVKLTQKGWEHYRNGNYSKAEKYFQKSLRKQGHHEKTYEGLALLKYKRREYGNAEYYIQKAYQLNSNSAAHTYNYARFANKNGNWHKAMELLYEIPLKGDFNFYRRKAADDADFRSMSSNKKFLRYLKGYRRLKVQPYYAYSSEDDGIIGENELFVIIENQKKILLSTGITQESNTAYWKNDYVIFDYPLTSTVQISLLEEDNIEHDNLLTVSGYLTPGNYNWTNPNTKSNLKVKVSDTDEQVHTTGTYIPPQIGIKAVAAAIGIGALAYIVNSSELDHTSNATKSSNNCVKVGSRAVVKIPWNNYTKDSQILFFPIAQKYEIRVTCYVLETTDDQARVRIENINFGYRNKFVSYYELKNKGEAEQKAYEACERSFKIGDIGWLDKSKLSCE